MMMSAFRRIKTPVWLAAALSLSACAQLTYRPLAPIEKVDTAAGYRLEQVLNQKDSGDIFAVLMFSGGGTRAAAFGYGVLEELDKQQGGAGKTLLDDVDIVFGISGGSVLAGYYALHGKETIPSFERRFLKQNFQKQVVKQVFSAANLPRLTSPQFGRGDLLQEQFENTLFGRATFGDLAKRRKGPFAVISATDMATGNRINFTQEYFDAMCLDLEQLPLARAVAASSAVPLVFSPLTLNNSGGRCGYALPERIQSAIAQSENGLIRRTRKEYGDSLLQYGDAEKRPFIHLLDGGLTDNLGLRSLLDASEMYTGNSIYEEVGNKGVQKIVIINVNAQNKLDNAIDRSADVPGFSDVMNAVINIPIDKYSEESLRSFRRFTDAWNKGIQEKGSGPQMYFVSLNLSDLPESELRRQVLNIPTSFYLPVGDINNLKEAAHLLLKSSPEYRRLLADLAVRQNAVPPQKVEADEVQQSETADPLSGSASDKGADGAAPDKRHASEVLGHGNPQPASGRQKERP